MTFEKFIPRLNKELNDFFTDEILTILVNHAFDISSYADKNIEFKGIEITQFVYDTNLSDFPKYIFPIYSLELAVSGKTMRLLTFGEGPSEECTINLTDYWGTDYSYIHFDDNHNFSLKENNNKSFTNEVKKHLKLKENELDNILFIFKYFNLHQKLFEIFKTTYISILNEKVNYFKNTLLSSSKNIDIIYTSKEDELPHFKILNKNNNQTDTVFLEESLYFFKE